MTSSDLFTRLDLSSARVIGQVAGLRPFRSGSPRIDVEHIEAKVVGHNYGHGGSGITMAWGSCLECLDLLTPYLLPDSDIAVLGSGIMGLCTASLLLDSGHRVTVYAEDFSPGTTSALAGGLWAPTHVGVGESPEEQARYERILRRSWNMFRELESERYGIEEIDLFEADDRCHALDPMPSGLVEEPRRLAHLPFKGIAPPGVVSKTLLIETPRFLLTLQNDIQERGGRLKKHRFDQICDVLQLEESIVVNCLGLGAGTVFGDKALVPIRGQLVVLKPAPKPFVLDHAKGYVISRRDCLLLGGTFEEGETDPRPQTVDCEEILENHREFFGLKH